MTGKKKIREENKTILQEFVFCCSASVFIIYIWHPKTHHKNIPACFDSWKINAVIYDTLILDQNVHHDSVIVNPLQILARTIPVRSVYDYNTQKFRSKLESFTELGAFFVLMAKIKFSILYQMLMHTDHENLVEKEATFEIFWVSNRRYEMKRTLQYWSEL